ncbi:MAG: helix-turn-helix domain-containing protein [Allomuricauda sp.]
MDFYAKTLLILLLSQCLPFSIFLFFTSRGRKVSNRLLGSFFFILSLQFILVFVKGFQFLGLDVYRLTLLVGIWFGPILLLYTKSLLLKEGERLDFKKNRVYLLPPLLFWVLVFFIQRFQTLEIFDSIITAAYYMYSYVYFKGRIKLKTAAERNSQKLAIRWIQIVLFTLIGITVIDVIEFVVRLIDGLRPINYYIFYVEMLGFLFVLNYYIFFGATRSSHFMGIQEPFSTHGQKPKYSSVEMSPNESIVLFNEIDAQLSDQKLYLKNIKIAELARLLEIPVNKVSRSINENCGESFSDLINRKRVEYAKKLLSNPKNNDKLLAIALDSGFNNKVSFYKNFKRLVGVSPSEFRDQASLKSSA